ncbi:hypothetical protein EVAR_16122_1 [Eumeta japonica]|uniref:Uncharacterized protein n=1 Tax=Eumeta variegata TaxID=151549 RepID=A0A4C1UIM0_EUMVA|nr:hypothetical protein EVAR_16122_1 [Eumeta japonica]
MRATPRSLRLRLRWGEHSTCPIFLSYKQRNRGTSESRLTQRLATKGTSLNDHLLPGPDLLQSLPGLLMIFPLDPSTDYTREVKINNGDHEEKVLGLTWQPSDDTLSFNLNFSKVPEEIIDGHCTPTKKEALTVVTSLLSKTVLAWLRSGPRSFKQFVAHRVAEINEKTAVRKWRWTPSSHNIADDTTRDFNRHHTWFTGPAFLYEEPERILRRPTEKFTILPTQPTDKNIASPRYKCSAEGDAARREFIHDENLPTHPNQVEQQRRKSSAGVRGGAGRARSGPAAHPSQLAFQFSCSAPNTSTKDALMAPSVNASHAHRVHLCSVAEYYRPISLISNEISSYATGSFSKNDVRSCEIRIAFPKHHAENA